MLQDAVFVAGAITRKIIGSHLKSLFFVLEMAFSLLPFYALSLLIQRD